MAAGQQHSIPTTPRAFGNLRGSMLRHGSGAASEPPLGKQDEREIDQDDTSNTSGRNALGFYDAPESEPSLPQVLEQLAELKVQFS